MNIRVYASKYKDISRKCIRVYTDKKQNINHYVFGYMEIIFMVYANRYLDIYK